MLKSYLTIAFRNLTRRRQYTILNLTALTLGVVPVILILLFVHYELGFDQYHTKKDRVYRIIWESPGWYGQTSWMATFPGPLPSAMVRDLADVVSAIRVGPRSPGVVKYGEREFKESEIVYADPGIFNIFSFELTRGNPFKALADPNSIVISESMAEKYFGGEDPMGKALTLDGFRRLQVTGVLKNIPRQSHFLADFLVPAALRGPSATPAGTFDENSWGFSQWHVYFLVREGTDITALEERFPRFRENYPAFPPDARYHFQPLDDIHLRSPQALDKGSAGSMDFIFLYSSLALVLLLISCVSYINLAVVSSAERGREVGVRKVNGASRRQLIFQFLGESVMLTFFATMLSVGLVAAILPVFNAFVEREIGIETLFGVRILQSVAGVILLVGGCAGSYPALILSGFKPANVLKGRFGGARPSRFRKALVVVQCACSLLFIVAPLIVRQQVRYGRDIDQKYGKDQILVLMLDRSLRDNLVAVKNELRSNPDVIQVSSMSYLLNKAYSGKRVQVPGAADGTTIDMAYSNIDFDYLELFGVEVTEGRGFSPEISGDVRGAYIVNQTAARALGWEGAAVGRQFEKGKVIGVVKDFHFESFHETIKPLYFFIDPEGLSLAVCVKMSTRNLRETIDEIGQTVRRIVPDSEFRYQFYDEAVDSQYRNEQRLEQLFSGFAFLAVGVACLGLFGLVSLTAEQRTKEIGIRKVLGASSLGIVSLLTRDYAKWVLVASVCAWPVAWYIADSWLQSFPYRVDLSAWVFLLCSFLLLGIVLLTVGYKALRVANANPVNALRYE